MEIYISDLKTSLYRQLEVLLRNSKESIFETDFMNLYSTKFLDIAKFKEHIINNRDWEELYKNFKSSKQTKEEMEDLFLCSINNVEFTFINNYIKRFNLEKLLNDFDNAKNESVFKFIL